MKMLNGVETEKTWANAFEFALCFWFLTARSGLLKRYIASTACWTHGLSEWPNHSAKSQSRAPLSCDNRRPQCPQLYAPGQDLQKDYRAMLEAMQRTCKEHAKNRKALTCYRQLPIFHPRSPWTDRCNHIWSLSLAFSRYRDHCRDKGAMPQISRAQHGAMRRKATTHGTQ